MANADFLSTTPGVIASDAGISSLDSTRRLYNFGDRVASLAPEQTPWFVYLSKVAKQSTDDPTFKFMEERHQWQRRNFHEGTGVSATAIASGDPVAVQNITLNAKCTYDKFGNKLSSEADQPGFLLKDQLIAIQEEQAKKS